MSRTAKLGLAGASAAALAVAALVLLYWHFLELWFVHSTIGPNITATYPGMALAALPMAVVGYLLRPWLQRFYQLHTARHAGQHEITRIRVQAVLDHLVGEKTSPATHAEIVELREMLSELLAKPNNAPQG